MKRKEYNLSSSNSPWPCSTAARCRRAEQRGHQRLRLRRRHRRVVKEQQRVRRRRRAITEELLEPEAACRRRGRCRHQLLPPLSVLHHGSVHQRYQPLHWRQLTSSRVELHFACCRQTHLRPIMAVSHPPRPSRLSPQLLCKKMGRRPIHSVATPVQSCFYYSSPHSLLLPVPHRHRPQRWRMET